MHTRKLKILFACTIALLFSAIAHAQYTWISATGTNWNTGSNWSTGSLPTATIAQFDGLPASGTSISITAATSAAALSLSSARTLALSIAGSSTTTLTLSGATVNTIGNVVISNFSANASTLTYTGPVTFGSNKVILTGGGTTSLTAGNSISLLGAMNASAVTFLGGGTWNGTSGVGGGVLRIGVNNPSLLTTSFIVGSSTSITNSGVLELDASNALPLSSSGFFLLINPYSQLFLTQANNNTTSVTVNGTGNNTTAFGRGAMRNSVASTWPGIVTLGSSSVFYTGTTLTLSNSINGSGQFIKEGAGTVMITGVSNSLTGSIVLSEGSITITKNNSLINPLDFVFSQSVAAGSNTTLTIPGSTSQTIGNLSSTFAATSGTFSQTLALGAATTLTITQTGNATFGKGSVATLTSIITGTATSYIVKTGAGILTLNNAGHTFSGGLTISQGEIRLAQQASMTFSPPITLSGGVLGSTGITSGVTITLAALNNIGSDTILLDPSITHSLRFASLGTNTGTLIVKNWAGLFDGTTGTVGHLYIGTTASLTAAQLAQIVFYNAGNLVAATQLSTGEIVPKAPITITPAAYGPLYNNVSNTISVSYSTTATYFTGNFQVQRSDATGVFANYTSNIIGTGTSATSGTISATFPASVAVGGYKVRVVNSAPYSVASADNGSSIAISIPVPYVTSLSAYNNVIPGSTITITGMNFNTTPANNVVYFGAVKARGNAGSSATVLNVTVPYGASMGFVNVSDTTTHLSGNSSYTLLPAFDHSLFETGSITMQPKVDYTTGTCPNIAAIADMDGDGLPDLVAVNKISRTLTIFQNQGTGINTFSTVGLSLALQGNPSNVKIADIDGDGRPDIVIAGGSGGSSIGVYRNTTPFTTVAPRTMSFATRTDVTITSVSGSAGVIAIADLDGDGKLDVVGACYATDPSKMVILRNTSSVGTVSFVVSGVTSGPNLVASALTSSLCIGDFNGDHLPDVAMVTQYYTAPGYLSVFKNTSSGPGSITFAAPLSVSTGVYPVDVTCADMDGDGAVDVVVTHSLANSVSVFKNNYATSAPALSFGSEVVISNALNNPAGITVGDLDGDGKADVVASNFVYGGGLNVFRNTSTPGNFSFTSIGVLGTNRYPAGINIGDLDGDSYPEIVTGNTGSDTGTTISIFRNTPLPIIGTVSGSDSVCLNANTSFTYSLSLPAGETGAWTSENPLIATVDASGNVHGVAAGTTNISYTVTVTRGSISRSVSKAITVKALPVVNITGFRSICNGFSTTLAGTPSGGTWSHANAVTTVNTSGIVTGAASSGTDIITYSYTSTGTGCVNTDTQAMTIIPVPNPGVISGPDSVCPAASITLITSGDVGGRWYSDNTLFADADTLTGRVTGHNPGMPYINYRIINGCGTYNAYKQITVISLPDAGVITGPSTVCVGAMITLSNIVSGGIWSGSNAAQATVNASGTVTGTGVGTPVISYTISNTCGSSSVTFSVAVNTVPATPAAISGAGSVCTANSISLADATTGGSWSSSNAAQATVNATGVVTALAAGTPSISYSVSNTCGASAPATATVTVLAHPDAVISSAAVPCTGYSTNIVFTGTSGAVASYNVDGGSNIDLTLTSGTSTFSTGTLTAPHTYQLHSVRNAACTTLKDTSVVIAPQQMVWIGGAAGHENNWGTTANWSCGVVPATTDSVIIPAVTYAPHIPVSGNGNAKSLSIATLASLDVDTTGVINVKGLFNNNGTVTGRGNVVLNGSTAQRVTGQGTVSNIQLNNTSGASVDTGSKLVITTALSIAAGTFTTNDSLELASADSGTAARIATLPSGTAVVGKVKVDQYVQGNFRRYRFWSHPFSDTMSLSQIQNYIDITGAGGSANGFTSTASNAPSVFRLDPYTGNSSLSYDPGWKPFTRINSGAADSNKLHPYQGIRLFFRGAKGEGLGYTGFYGMYAPSPVTVKMTGHVNQGPLSVKLAKGITDPANQEYNMIGNPYPSPIDIGTVLYNAKVANQVTGSAFYIWEPTMGAGGNYIIVPFGVSSPAPYYLQANTSFQVRAHHDGAAISFAETDKVAKSDIYLFRAPADYTVLNVYDTSYRQWDMLRFQFSTQATDSVDEMDATKPSGSDFGFYSLSGEGRKLGIDARPYTTGKTIPLGIASGYEQSFIIRADNVAVPAGNTLILHDKLLEQYTELKAGTEYKFTITNKKATQGDDRFELNLKPVSTEAAATTFNVTMTPNPATDNVKIAFTSDRKEQVTLRVTDMTGTSIYYQDMGIQQSGSINVALSNLPAGIYITELTHGSNKTTHKLIKE